MDSKPRSGGLATEEKRIFMDMVRALALTFATLSLFLALPAFQLLTVSPLNCAQLSAHQSIKLQLLRMSIKHEQLCEA